MEYDSKLSLTTETNSQMILVYNETDEFAAKHMSGTDEEGLRHKRRSL